MSARAIIAVLALLACGTESSGGGGDLGTGNIYGTTTQSGGTGGTRGGTVASNAGGSGGSGGGGGTLQSRCVVDGGVCFNGGLCCGAVCCAPDEMCCAGTCRLPSVNQPVCPF